MSSTTLLLADIPALTRLQDSKTSEWHDCNIIWKNKTWQDLVLSNHGYNYELWHQEDQARRDDLGFEHVYQAKRKIDYYNQQRNNFMEKMDLYWQQELQVSTNNTAPLHTETPGMIIDRLSILSLKIYHMALQTRRQDCDKTHKETCEHKLAVLKIQRNDLMEALLQLHDEIKEGKKTFKLYKQMKMYNDPNLNPQLYTHSHE